MASGKSGKGDSVRRGIFEMNTYYYILDKINALKGMYPSFRSRSDDYIFSALCVKANFYKNPALEISILFANDIKKEI